MSVQGEDMPERYGAKHARARARTLVRARRRAGLSQADLDAAYRAAIGNGGNNVGGRRGGVERPQRRT